MFGPGATLPVEQVSWDDAMEFCQKLTERERAAGRLPEGYAYTLPTEAQWENACRAGTEGDYAGDLDAMAWYARNSGDKTHPVATKKPNAWGFYDMHGNVWEWCRDLYVESYDADDTIDPSVGPASVGPADSSDHVLRGGGWSHRASYCRSAYRYWDRPDYRGDNRGFRPALSLTGK